MKKASKEMVVNGEEIFLKPGLRHDLICCDCGLVHQFKYKRTLRGIMIMAWRDNRATRKERTRRERDARYIDRILVAGRSRGVHTVPGEGGKKRRRGDVQGHRRGEEE